MIGFNSLDGFNVLGCFSCGVDSLDASDGMDFVAYMFMFWFGSFNRFDGLHCFLFLDLVVSMVLMV